MRSAILISALFLSSATFAQTPEQPVEAAADDAHSPEPAPSEPQVVVNERAEIPEFYYQPPVDGTSIQLRGGSGGGQATISSKAGAKVADVSVAATEYQLNLTHTFDSDISVGAAISYASSQSNYSPSSGSNFGTKKTGLEDLELSFQKIVFRKRSGYVFGLGLEGSTGKGKSATKTAEGNQLSGGWAAVPMIGFFTAVKPNTTLGAAVSYAYRAQRVVENNSTPAFDDDYTGGNAFHVAAFAQQMVNQVSFELAIGITARDSVEDRAESSPPATTTEDAYTSLNASFEAHWYFQPDLTLFGQARVTSSPEHSLSSANKVSSDTETDGAIGLRFAFD